MLRMIRSLIKIEARNFSSSSHLEKYSALKTLSVNEVDKYVLNVEFNRPKVKNAMNQEMFNEIKQCFDSINSDNYYRAVVLTANGSVFSAGIDLTTFQTALSLETEDVGRKSLSIRALIMRLQDSFRSVAKCQKPIISAVNGPCIGAGINLISMTDIRYCTKDAYFSVKEVDLGLAADLGVLQFLPKIVGNDSFVREATYTGKKIDSSEAKEFGLVSRVYENQEEVKKAAFDLARSIAAKSPIAVQGSKVCLDFSRDHNMEDGLQFMVNWNMSMLQSVDLQKSAIALITKSTEPPEFDDL